MNANLEQIMDIPYKGPTEYFNDNREKLIKKLCDIGKVRKTLDRNKEKFVIEE